MTRIWNKIKDFKEILFEEHHGIAKITINRPRYRNAFTPLTVSEISKALAHCREAQHHSNNADCAVVDNEPSESSFKVESVYFFVFHCYSSIKTSC